MRRLSPVALAAAAALTSTAALAADMAPPVLRGTAPVVQPAESGGWYLRGDIGAAGNSIGNFGVLQNGAQVPIEVRMAQRLP